MALPVASWREHRDRHFSLLHSDGKLPARGKLELHAPIRIGFHPLLFFRKSDPNLLRAKRQARVVACQQLADLWTMARYSGRRLPGELASPRMALAHPLCLFRKGSTQRFPSKASVHRQLRPTEILPTGGGELPTQPLRSSCRRRGIRVSNLGPLGGDGRSLAEQSLRVSKTGFCHATGRHFLRRIESVGHPPSNPLRPPGFGAHPGRAMARRRGGVDRRLLAESLAFASIGILSPLGQPALL